MNLNQWYEKGLTVGNYMKSLDTHKSGFNHINNHFEVPEDNDFFAGIKKQKLRTIIIAEPWCGHCMLDIPIFMHLAQKAQISVRILPRDDNLDLMEKYLTNNKRVIPIFIFIDEDGKEVTNWGPLAESTKQFVDHYKQNLPAKDAHNYDEKFKAFINAISKAFKEDVTLWNGVYNSMRNTLLNV